MYDIHTKLDVDTLRAPAAIATDTTTSTSILNVKTFDALELVIATGVITDGSYAVQVWHGNDSALADATQAVVAVDGLGDLLVSPLTAMPTIVAANDNTQFEVGYIGDKNYVQVRIVSTGTTTGGIIAVYAIKSKAIHQPV